MSDPRVSLWDFHLRTISSVSFVKFNLAGPDIVEQPFLNITCLLSLLLRSIHRVCISSTLLARLLTLLIHLNSSQSVNLNIRLPIARDSASHLVDEFKPRLIVWVNKKIGKWGAMNVVIPVILFSHSNMHFCTQLFGLDDLLRQLWKPNLLSQLHTLSLRMLKELRKQTCFLVSEIIRKTVRFRQTKNLASLTFVRCFGPQWRLHFARLGVYHLVVDIVAAQLTPLCFKKNQFSHGPILLKLILPCRIQPTVYHLSSSRFHLPKI